jgi:hypothetical protein
MDIFLYIQQDVTELIMNIQEPHAKTLFAAVIEALPYEELNRVVIAHWTFLWYACRRVIHEGIY